MNFKSLIITLVLSFACLFELCAQFNNKLKSNSKGQYETLEPGATPKGGMAKLYLYFKKRAKFPKGYEYPNDYGRVFVKFIILETGEIDKASVQIVDKLELSNEPWVLTDKYFRDKATSLISNMPKWKPAKRDGEKIKELFILPVTFTR